MNHHLLRLTRLGASLALAFGTPLAAHAATSQDLGSVQADASTGSSADSGTATDATSRVYTHKQLQHATQPVKAVTRDEAALVGPDGGGMQALSLVPNVHITSYNATSVSSRSQISLRGVKVGYNSIPGDLSTNAITAELDGVPLNSLIQGTGWHSPETTIGALLQGINVVEGPGNPRERWYDSLGGTIDFIPLQPSRHAHTKVELSAGSFHTGIESIVHDTGEHDGWSSVFGLANANSHAIRDTGDNLPSHTVQAYFKTRKSLESGSLSLGAYAVQNDEQRPNMIPVSAADAAANGIGLYGTDGQGHAVGPVYSQQSSGYYSTLPRSVWQKHNYVVDYMYWGRLRLHLAPDLTLSNLTWIRNGNVNHYRQNDYVASSPGGEYYIEHSLTFGDRLAFDQRLDPHNLLSYGGYFIHARSNNQYIGYTPRAGISLLGDGITSADINGIGYNTTTNDFWAAFLQDKIKPVSSLTVVPGLRYVDFQTDFSNTSAQAATDLGLPAGFNAASGDLSPDVSTSFHKVEPSLGLNWALDPSVSAFGSYAIAYHNPSQGNYDQGKSTGAAPNLAALQLVKSASYDVGLRYANRQWHGLRNVYASIEYFHTQLSNQTVRYTNPNDPNQTTFGTGSATLRGVDLQLRAEANEHWRGFANLGWLSSHWDSYFSYKADQSFNGLPVSNAPKLTANAGITYRDFQPDGVIDTTLWDQYTGASYLFDNTVVGPSTQQNPGYNLLNLNVKYSSAGLARVIPGAQVASIALSVSNLLDKEYNSTEYISSGGYFQTPNGGYVIANPGAPRAVYLSLSAQF